jgi:hypothetical protein
MKKEGKENRGAKRCFYPVFEIIEDKLSYKGTCLNKNHVSKVIGNYSANVGMYLNLELNKLGNFVVVEIEAKDDEFIDSKTSMIRAWNEAERRYNRSKLNFTIDKMKDLSDEQVNQISKILNDGK